MQSWPGSCMERGTNVGLNFVREHAGGRGALVRDPRTDHDHLVPPPSLIGPNHLPSIAGNFREGLLG